MLPIEVVEILTLEVFKTQHRPEQPDLTGPVSSWGAGHFQPRL